MRILMRKTHASGNVHERPVVVENLPKLREIAVCDANPILADRLIQVLQSDAWLSASFHVTRIVDLAEALKSSTLELLILDPSQDAHFYTKWANIIGAFPNGISLIGYCTAATTEEAQALMSNGFRAVVPKTVETAEFLRIVHAVTLKATFLHESFTEKNFPSLSLVMTSSPSTPLTERESKVLRQLALGGSLKEIAASLNISIKTVDTYKTRAIRKLDLRSRSDIVRYAIQSGWMHGQPSVSA